jgi:TatD DNase family protein
VGTKGLAVGASRIQTALGLHPQLAAERIGELPLFERLLPSARYVGEIGLDGSPDQRSHWQAQLTAFHRILDLCGKHGGRLMSIHSRRAVGEVIDAIATHESAGVPVLHWFSGTKRELVRAIELGCWFSVGPTMLATAKGTALAGEMPRSRILTESDGPFAQLDGRTALPWDTDLAVAKLATIWCVPINEARQQLLGNLRHLVQRTDPSARSEIQ